MVGISSSCNRCPAETAAESAAGSAVRVGCGGRSWGVEADETGRQLAEEDVVGRAFVPRKREGCEKVKGDGCGWVRL